MTSCDLKQKLVDIKKNSEKTTNVDPENNPYTIVFKKLFPEDSALNEKIKYISLDLTEVVSEVLKVEYYSYMKSFCEENNFELMKKTINELEEEGLIKDLYFEEGIVIIFKDLNSTDNKVKFEATKWRSGLGAIGATYILEKSDTNLWQLIKEGEFWVS